MPQAKTLAPMGAFRRAAVSFEEVGWRGVGDDLEDLALFGRVLSAKVRVLQPLVTILKLLEHPRKLGVMLRSGSIRHFSNPTTFLATDVSYRSIQRCNLCVFLDDSYPNDYNYCSLDLS